MSDELGAHQFCYLTTTGRATGRPHRIEIWFAAHGRTLYLLSGGGDGADWVRNLLARPDVTVEVGGAEHRASARTLEPGTDEDALARRLVAEKYQPGYDGDLSGWRERSLPVALDLA